MKKINAMEEEFDRVTLFDHSMLFTNLRVDRTTVPEGLYVYELRHGDELDYLPFQVGESIIVNCFGTVITNEPLPLIDGFLDIDPEEDWNFEGFSMTIDDYTVEVNDI